MEGVAEQLERTQEALEQALGETDDEMASYHIRRAAQRLVAVQSSLDAETAGGDE